MAPLVNRTGATLYINEKGETVVHMPELNEKLIACVLEHIESHPDEYEQNDWLSVFDLHRDGEYCGTRGCFAGWAVALSTPVEKWGELPPTMAVSQSSRGLSYYHERAEKLLGLTPVESHDLFEGANGDPVGNLAIIKERLRRIRINRGLAPNGPVVDASGRK